MSKSTFRSEQVGSITFATIGPEFKTLDEQAIEEVAQFMLGLAARNDVTCLVLDMSETTFFGSGLLAAIFRTWNRVTGKGGRFAICGLNKHCESVLRSTRLDTLWSIYPGRQEAAADLARQ